MKYGVLLALNFLFATSGLNCTRMSDFTIFLRTVSSRLSRPLKSDDLYALSLR
jgi:hypothetical protein